jgi:hypothetical protein
MKSLHWMGRRTYIIATNMTFNKARDNMLGFEVKKTLGITTFCSKPMLDTGFSFRSFF